MTCQLDGVRSKHADKRPLGFTLFLIRCDWLNYVSDQSLKMSQRLHLRTGSHRALDLTVYYFPTEGEKPLSGK